MWMEIVYITSGLCPKKEYVYVAPALLPSALAGVQMWWQQLGQLLWTQRQKPCDEDGRTALLALDCYTRDK